MKSIVNESTSSPVVRRSERVSRKAEEAKAKKAEETEAKEVKQAEKEAMKKQKAAAAAAAEAQETESMPVVAKKKMSAKRKKGSSTMTADPEPLDITGEASSSNNAESSTSTTMQNAAEPPAPVARPKKQRKTSKKAATAAAMTVPIPEDSTAAQLAELIQVQARLRRALSQRMYVVSRERLDAYTETFDVLGSIGNLYKVTIGPKMKCSCRDFVYRRIHCKHIFLVLARVFHLTGESNAYQTLKLSRSELELIFACQTPDPCVLAGDQIQQAINNKKNGKLAAIATRRPLNGEDCPICYEELEDLDISQTVFCATCGNNIHKSCFEQWANNLEKRYQAVTCVFCRSEWHTPGSVKLEKNREGYVNFQEEANLPTNRDTSTYGQR